MGGKGAEMEVVRKENARIEKGEKASRMSGVVESSVRISLNSVVDNRLETHLEPA